MRRPIITLLTDFGSSDHYAGAMKGVMLGICPQVQLIDISHEIAPYAVSDAAYTLAQAWPCFPPKTVHLIVVDPGVGSARRPILAEAGGHYFVAPDNGVLTMVLDSLQKYRVREITAAQWFRRPVSQTFHGRDIFAPVAAHLARGVPPAKFGKRIGDSIRLSGLSAKRTQSGQWTGTVLKVDRFGNVVTSFGNEVWPQIEKGPFRIEAGSGRVSRLLGNYSEAADDAPFAIRGSAGYVEISCREKNAAHILGISAGSALLLTLEPRLK